jgi:SPP1 family predicted phage head-tail adaptor
MGLAAGTLDRRVTIQRNTPTQDAGGQEIEGWTDLVTVSASWRRATARETLAASEINAQVTDIFVIRWSTDVQDVSPKDQLLYAGKTYDIADCAEIGRREGIEITAAARSDA